MESLNTIIQHFNPVSLEEMDSVKLMDRRDTKFLFPEKFLPIVLGHINKNYKVLEINNLRQQDYESLYYDTEDFRFYTHHHNGKLNRHKIRMRQYVNSLSYFLEVKFKDNKANTRKRRIEIPADVYHSSDIREEDIAFIHKRMKYNPGILYPKLYVHYTRTTLVDNNFRERVTIDTHLKYKFGNTEKKLEGLVIAEIKKEGIGMNSPAINSLLELRCMPGRFSKYSSGVALLYPHLKHNRFKPVLLNLNKILYGNVA